MPLTVQNSARRRRKNPDEKLRPGESSSAQVMAPTRMKLRVRRHDNATGGADAVAGGGQPEEEEEEEERSRESSGHSSRRKTSNNTPTTAAGASSSSPPSSSSSASARAVMAAEETSPDSKCPICLDRFNNLAYLDRCLHRFCFPCIQEWSHNKAECPLCKQPFASILHSVRAEDDFKEYTLRPAPPNSSVAATVAMVAAMASAARSDHQMRLMLRRHRGADNGETTTRRRRRERGGRRVGVWEWYLDSPPIALPPLPQHPAVTPVVAEDSEEVEGREEQRVRRGADLAERGVIFEGLTGLGGAVAPVAPNDRASRRLMTRLAARQRLQRDGGTVRRLRDRETVAFRRALYRSDIRVRGVSGVNGNSNQGQQQRDITAESFRRNPVHLNRLRPWLRRELTVLYGAHGSLVDIVQRIIMARLARHGLEDTPTIEEELRPFLLARTDHFLHELVSFARSPLSLENYDLQAVYEPPAAALELEVTSSSTDSSSVIAISEGEEEERLGGAHDDVIQTGSCLSLSAWDDETPGPSYSTAEPSCSLAPLSFSPAPQEAANEEEGEEREEECLIVGYKKPIAERTPELVQLSSDTEEEEEEKKDEENTAEKLPPLPSTTACLPTIPPSTSGACRDEQDEKPKDKDEEVDGRGLRARSWSGSSGRSRNSAPGEAESWRGGEAAREKRRRKRSRGGRERSGDRLRKSGTLYNPNRSIYPAMMRHRSHSPSPLHSSVESSSPLAPSPPDSSWEYHCSQSSPLTSPVCSSSSSSSSSSALCSSPLPSSQTPPTPSLSPSDRTHHGEKPGGKRKYKSRHLDSNDKDPTWRPSSSHRREKRRERRRGRDGGRRRERQRREAHREGGGDSSTKRSREDRSPSVEIIYEGTVTSSATQPPAGKRRRRRPRRTQHGSSPVIITLDSDSSHDDVNNKRSSSSSSSSSPLSSQQTVDFSDLPPLPLVHSAGVGGALSAEFGELPVDILDRGSEPEAAGPVAIDNSDHDVDVESVDVPLLEDADKGAVTEVNHREADGGSVPTTTEPVHTGHSEVSDRRLLAAILNDLKGITAPKCDLSFSFDPSCSSSTRNKLCRDQCVSRSDQDSWAAEARHPDPDGLDGRQSDIRDQTQGFDLTTFRTPTPPLLTQASPVRAYDRNTPPPLKHKDAASPQLLLISPSELLSPHSGSHISCSLSEELPEPPLPTLNTHFTKALAQKDTHVVSQSISNHRASACENRSREPDYSPHLDFSAFHSSKFLSNHVNTKESSSGPRAADLRPVNSSCPTDFHSTSTGCRNKTVSASSVCAEGTAAGSEAFSGASWINSHSTKTEQLAARLSPSRGRSAHSGSLSPTDVHPGSPKSATDLHSSSAAPPADAHSSGSVSEPWNHTAFFSSAVQTPHRKCSSQPEHAADAHSEHLHPPDCDGQPPQHTGPRFSVDPHSKPLLRDSHMTPPPQSVENQWRSDTQSPSDTHTHSAT